MVLPAVDERPPERPRVRRTVTLGKYAPDARKYGGSPRLWAFSIQDLAHLFEMSTGAVRKAMFDGRFDPTDLESICAYWEQRSNTR